MAALDHALFAVDAKERRAAVVDAENEHGRGADAFIRTSKIKQA